jgi:hypothetical protein
MSFNIFGPATKKDIRVGYINPDKGYIQNVSIFEANKYAALNPGTIFILKTRDRTRYLNINEVNALTIDDLDVDGGNVCDKIKGLRPGERAPFDNFTGLPSTPLPPFNGDGDGDGDNNSTGPLGPLSPFGDAGCVARIFISGGGGVGAVASPIFGTDGSLLAVTVVRGGFGYKYPPKATLIDSCRRGSGAVLRTITGGISPTTEYFDQEDDFEIYDLTPDGTELSGYGNRFGPNGEDLGEWDPNLFATLAADPVGAEIQKYQDFLRQGINPFWHTRKETPISVTFRDKTTRGIHQCCSSHKFKFTADSFKDSNTETIVKKVKRNGILEVLEERQRKLKQKGFSNFCSNDNDDLQVEATQGKFTASNERKQDGHSINDLTYIFESTKDFKPKPKINRVIEDSFMNRYAVSPVPASNVPSSDYAGQVATLEWEENFPYTGEYIFRGMADNVATLYLDNQELIKTKNFRGDPTDTIKKTIEEGVHRIKIDLLNIPIKEKQNVKPKIEKVPVEFEVYGQGSNRHMAINFTFKSKDGKESFTLKNLDASRSSYKKTIEIDPTKDYIVNAVPTNKPIVGNADKKYPIVITGNSSTSGLEVNDRGKTIKYDDNANNGFDKNAELRIVSSSPGVNAKFSSDGTELLVKGSGDVTLKFSWDDNSKTSGLAVGKLTVGGQVFQQINEKGSQTKTIRVNQKSEEIFSAVVEQGTMRKNSFRKHGRGIEGGNSKSNIIFADFVGSANDNDDIQVKVNIGEFVPSKKRSITGTSKQGTQTRGTYNLTFRVPPSTKKNKGQSSITSQGLGTGTIFTTTDYIRKADRKLWRTNVYGRGGFLNEYGICPFDTRKPLDGNPYAGKHVIRWENIDFPADGNYKITVDADDSVKIFIGNRIGGGAMGIGNGLGDIEQGGDEVIIENGRDKTTYTKFFKKGKYRIRTELTQVPGGRFTFERGSNQPSRADVSARFINRDGKKYLKVNGSGSAEISFRLRVNDNPRTSGVFASKVKIGLPPNDYVLLSRSRSGNSYKEKEVITGSDVFEAGREYLVDTIGSSRGTGSVIKNNGNTIEYDDNISNGFDENADLSITKVKNLQSSPVKGVNPMALAIKIEVGEIEQIRISPKTWYQNPMGAAFTIDAPLPPIPESPIPIGEGRCPRNPIWTTRFPGGQKKWWPVNHPAWSRFTNRFALSPLPPLNTLNSDGGGGVTYENTWPLEIPYDGFYGIKGTADNAGRILIDGQEVYKLKGFKNSSPKIKKVKLIAGKHEVKVEVENFRQENTKIIKKKIFNTQDWQKSVKEGPPTPAELLVEYRGLNQGSTKTVRGEKSYAIRTEGESRTAGRRVRNNGREIQFDDNITNGFDENASLKIESTSPGVSAKFNGDGTQMIVKGKGNVSLKFSWDDKPNASGLSVGTLKVGNGSKVSWTTRQKGTKGSSRKTINVGEEDSKEVIGTGGFTVKGNEVRMKDGDGNDINSIFSIESSTVDAKFSPDGRKINYKGSGEITLKLQWNDDPKKYGKAVDSIAVGGKVWNQRGEKNLKIQTIKVTAKSNAKAGIKSGKSIGGVTYTGPDIFRYIDTRKNVWSDFMNKNSISPFIPPLTTDNPDIVGERTFTWSNVDFPENGSYEFEFQSDDVATLFINDQEVAVSKSFRGTPRKRFVNLSRGKYDLKVTLTNIQLPKDIFANSNPTGFALKIIKDIRKVVSTPPWTKNPLCASAIIIPPPCPKDIGGNFIVKEIIPEEPGNGYPPPPGGGPPVILVLDDIPPTFPGIGYTSTDRILFNGIPFEPILGTFGNVIGITTAIPVGVGTPGGPGGSPGDRIYGITEYPNITMPSDTGVGFRGRPVFKPVIVPELVFPEDQLLQVTDLVGLKQTGYVNGKPYYGSTFSRDGILYAGVYETTGDLIQVYATLQESVDNRVTTRASAILRQGSDVTSNDPRLNIPNTPDNLV